MTIAGVFHNYQTNGAGGVVGGRCSPALRALELELEHRFGTTSLGCYGVRSVRGGIAPSTHGYGAALDVDYGRLNVDERRQEIAVWCIAWSEEWKLQAVHDYIGCRIWRAGRTTNPADACSLWWKAQRRDSNGMGSLWAHWLHLEVHPSGWNDPRGALDRGIT